jgi:hypothetical protein
MAIGLGSVVINAAASGGAVPAVIGEVIAANGGNWDVLWQSGDVALNIPAAALYEWITVACGLRPAVRLNAAGIAPASAAVGMVISQTADRHLIRTLAGYQYVATLANTKFLDV